MFLYYGKTFESARAGGSIVGVTCEYCGQIYYYQLTRIGAGAQTASYGFGKSRASEKAQDLSESDLRKRLALEAELVPCPKCHWISDELVDGYRLGRYRGIGKLAFALGLAGSILSLVAAWFIHIGHANDRWLLPFLLIGGPAAFVGIAIALLLLRGWLRGLIQPNRGFPGEPHLPPGTPPALLMDEATETLRPVVQTSVPVDSILDFQIGRHTLPRICCECLQPSDGGRGYPIIVTNLIDVEIPRCRVCSGKSKREWIRVTLFSLFLALLVGSAMAVLMIRAVVELEIVIGSILALLAATVVIIFLVASARTVPVKVVGRDQSRGVLRLRFRNSDYVKVVMQRFNPSELKK